MTILGVILCVAATPAALETVSYHEGFEGAMPKVELWAKNGEATVAFVGASSEQAFEGRRSLKLDVTLTSGSYQHAFGHIWNDFDDARYRDHVFAYPVLNGVVDTIQWEGFRKGVDDVRYLSTLLDRVEKAKADPARRALALDAEKWLSALDPEGDLDGLRDKIVEWILRLEP